MREPVLHSYVTDGLPEDHPLAWESVVCLSCPALVHSIPNECMRPWFETGRGPRCFQCFVTEFGDGCEPGVESWGLPD